MQNATTRRNNIPLLTWLHGRPVSHFRLYEFESRSGFVMLHPTVLTALELTRRDLNEAMQRPVQIIITGATRTQEDNDALGARLGYTDSGGLVSRNSRHLAKFGGIAVDFYAQHADDRSRIHPAQVHLFARDHFDFVKSDYADGHVHADQRERGI